MADTPDTTEEGGAGPLLKNRYRLGRVLGRGGMCIVYQAWDTRLQRNVAVKRLEPPLNEDPRTRARFDREGRALAQLSHPNLVTLIDRGSTENEDYLVFEYIEGRSLKELTREGPMTASEAGRIAGQVAEGLGTAHAVGIVHRDIKPQNILIDRNGHAKVSDFGIATGPDWTRVTRAGSIIGSARYMSPEQIRSKPVDARTDVYSLGVVMYEMLAGHPPFDGTNMPEIARQHLNNTPPPLAEIRDDLPPGLERVVMRCLEKLPEDRFVSMDELLGALVGLGLYAPQRAAEMTPPHKRQQKRGTADERRPRHTIGGTADDSYARTGEGGGEGGWQRDWVRAQARKKRAARRWKILGTLAAIVVIVVLALVLLWPDAGAPAVVGLPLDPAPEGKADDHVLLVTVTREPTPVAVTDLADYDPEGDETENPDLLSNLIDGKESTSWRTELYRSAEFGGLKSGVGFDFTLEEEATIVEIVSTVEGWKGELLQNISSGPAARLATLDGDTNQIIALREPLLSGRMWFTELAPLTESRWGVDISEIHFYR